MGSNTRVDPTFRATGLFVRREVALKRAFGLRCSGVSCSGSWFALSVLKGGLSGLRHGVLDKLPQAGAGAQPSGSLWRQWWCSGCCRVGARPRQRGLVSDTFEDVLHERNHDAHSFLRQAQALVNVLQNPGEVGGETVGTAAASVSV